MKFSVLLPTRNRLELLRYAIESVRRQKYESWEIVVSDNESEDDVRGYIASLAEPRIRYLRTERFVPVTENWNRALAASTGDYVLMLGDDDCILPGYFQAMAHLIQNFSSPDCIYCEAIQFAYPGVMPGHEKAFLQTSYSDIVSEGGNPYLLDRGTALRAVRKSMALRFACSYNMQHSLVSVKLIEALKRYGLFFQSPYPDYYATNVILLTAKTFVVDPTPRVAIGISPKSFGYYHFNERSDEGSAFLNNLSSSDVPGDCAQDLLPGNSHLTCWYLSMARVAKNFGKQFGVTADVRRYRLSLLLSRYPVEGPRLLRRFWPRLRWPEKFYFTLIILRIYLLAKFWPGEAGKRRADALFESLNPYPRFDPHIRIVEHKNILDLFEAELASH